MAEKFVLLPALEVPQSVFDAVSIEIFQGAISSQLADGPGPTAAQRVAWAAIRPVVAPSAPPIEWPESLSHDAPSDYVTESQSYRGFNHPATQILDDVSECGNDHCAECTESRSDEGTELLALENRLDDIVRRASDAAVDRGGEINEFYMGTSYAAIEAIAKRLYECGITADVLAIKEQEKEPKVEEKEPTFPLEYINGSLTSVRLTRFSEGLVLVTHKDSSFNAGELAMDVDGYYKFYPNQDRGGYWPIDVIHDIVTAEYMLNFDYDQQVTRDTSMGGL